MVSTEVVSASRLGPELSGLPTNVRDLFEAVVRLVDDNPPSPHDPGHPEHGTRIFLPTPEGRETSAFIGWEEVPEQFSTVDDSGRILELDEIAHVNVESINYRPAGTRNLINVATYRNYITMQGLVVRESHTDSSTSIKILSPEAVTALTKRLTADEEPEALVRDRLRRAARWQLKFALSPGPKSPQEAAELGPL